MESPSNCDLPSDIIVDILLRLPVKSLLQFKCVCKQWNALIGSPSFVNQHFGHEGNQERLFVLHYEPCEDQYTFALFVDEMFSEYEEPDHLQIPDTCAALLGPLNGIFCLVGKSGRLALLNPAMRQFKLLPLHVDVQPHLCSYYNFFGFGLDPLSGDYKLVWIQYLLDEEEYAPSYPPLVSVYNSSGDSWRQIEDVDLVNAMYRAYRSLCNTYLKGFYYWVMEFLDSNVAILAFDMSSETFQEIQIPDGVITEERDFDLTLYGDSIALLSYDYFYKIDKSIDVWVMKDEGCWTKSYSLGPFQGIRWPLGFWKKNELLLETYATLLTLNNISTQKLRTTEARRKANGSFRHWIFSYKESLVSIKEEVLDASSNNDEETDAESCFCMTASLTH